MKAFSLNFIKHHQILKDLLSFVFKF